MIYIYIAICVSMICYNIVYIFILRHRANSLLTNGTKFKKAILEQIKRIENGEEVSEKHKKHLCRSLSKIWGITAFDKALESLFQESPENVEKYLIETYSVFEYLTTEYISKDTVKIAYFPYILYKYGILKHSNNEEVKEILFDLLRSKNVYCRENTLKAIYSMEDARSVVSALRIIDKILSFHHPKLICDGLLEYKGDKEELKNILLLELKSFSVSMRVNILNFFRFGNIRCDREMLSMLKNEKEDNEIRFSCIRYFEKFPNDEAMPVLQEMAENLEMRTWEYQAIATSALKSYPGDATFRILVKNLSSSNWYIRQNSAISCEKLGYTYHDLINVFDGDDRYAREIMRYRLDRRKAEDKAVSV